MGGDAHHWFSTYVWVDLPTFERDFMNRFDYVHPEKALYMIKDRVQKPLESVAEYRNRFYRMFVKTKRGEQVGRDLFIDGLRSRTIRAKLRKQFSPITHTLQQITAAAEETERKFAANFPEGEDYPRDGDSTELARARAEPAALQNKFENMGFVSGPVTYMEQIGPKRVILSETPSISAAMIPPPPVEAPVRSNESAAIFELTKTLISLIQESKKEQREHNARLEAMMRNMRPIAVRAPPMQQGLAPAPELGGVANNLNVCVYGATEFRFTSNPEVVVLAEATAFQRRAAPGISHVSTVVVFSGGITAFDPARQAAIKSTLYRWGRDLAVDWDRWLTRHGDECYPMDDIEVNTLRTTLRKPPVVLPELAPFQPRRRAARRSRQESAEAEEEEEEEEAEEETSEEEEEAYSEYSEGEQSEEEDEDDEEVESGDDQEPTHDELEWVPGPDRRKENPEAAAQRKKEIAEGKRLAIDPAPNDPFKDPEPPKPEHGDLTATTSGAATTRRRSRSRSRSTSPSASARPPIRQRVNEGLSPSSPIHIPPSP
ncbi:hypothetical protein CBR_g45364 [Chara braunii]|uniref:Retrotransposon gag domain-containing protein n=1 Tax=Chara braunii TaxID=69332 RepID=A0A388LYA2_CHABU|nr:hypothetical protein CBR_g45364 [Chara braunii]|eukprot:GBG87304.1 hypothetical protein CBR_g45364 [Chara braunii]